MNKGFTLMEVLAVVLVLAIVGAMAVPSFRSMNEEQKMRRARIAAVKVAEAIKSVRIRTGQKIDSSSFTGTETESYVLSKRQVEEGNAPAACQNTGIPPRSLGTLRLPDLALTDLFACGYLRPEDFVGLPYSFAYSDEDEMITVTNVTSGKKHSGDECKFSVEDPNCIFAP